MSSQHAHTSGQCPECAAKEKRIDQLKQVIREQLGEAALPPGPPELPPGE